MKNIVLKGIEDTLFIPLMSRKYVSERFPEYFYDRKSLEIVQQLPPNQILEKSNEYSKMASASRSVILDDLAVHFIKKHDQSNIVCIGCGLETMAWRLSEFKNKAHFYEIDFKGVIEQRKEILGCLDHETLISGNIHSLDLDSYMNCDLPTLFVVAGVFEYFKENEVLELIKKLQKKFKNAEMIFDAVSSSGLKIANRYVQKTGNTDAMMYFYVNDAKDFAIKSQTTLIKQIPAFHLVDASLKSKLRLYTKISMFVNDQFNMTIMLHLSL